MEPADIDWKNIVSLYDPDDVYERINAPKWLDLSAPDRPTDDVAWFCRPDCHHPKAAEDFDRWTASPKVKPMRSNSAAIRHGELNRQRRDANLKIRGAVATFHHSPTKLKLNSMKSSEELENQNPNKGATPLTVKAKKMPVVAKEEAGKSSIETKRGIADEETEEVPSNKTQAQPRLKSIQSARNLFSGKDILSQISEFFHELKRLATGRDTTPIHGEEKKDQTKNFLAENENQEASSKDSVDGKKAIISFHGKKAIISSMKSGGVPKKCEPTVSFNGGDEKNRTPREVSAFPPTPQRFPSPTSHRQNAKASHKANCSALGKASKSTSRESGVLQELGLRREEKRGLIPKNEECSVASVASEAEGSLGDFFWFFKPCTYLA